MITLIQKIETIWTKESRGGEGATIRNKLPDKMPVDFKNFEVGVYLDEIEFSENDNFKNLSSKKLRKINEIQIRELQFELLEDNNKLDIKFYRHGGLLKKVGVLNLNTWGQLIKNERIPLEHTWSYSKTVYNIFYGNVDQMNVVMDTKQKTFRVDWQKLLY